MTQSLHIEGMTCTGCSAQVKYLLEQHPEVSSAEITLESGQVELTSSAELSTASLQELLGESSKYKVTSNQTAEIVSDPASTSWLATYKPLLLIFLFITVTTGLSSMDSGSIDVMQWMNSFMAGFFIVFGFFKFLNLKGFASSYAMYDLLAQRVKSYGYVYPFIEVGLGIAYLVNFNPQFTNIATIVVMGFSSLGVIQSVVDKKKIRCACLGDVFNLPMSSVTIIEDLLMVGMAVVMLLV